MRLEESGNEVRESRMRMGRSGKAEGGERT